MKNNKAFTLIELLVVVLIIGILAAIAVPQYQVAVAKSEYSTLKFKTRALAEAVNRYHLATGSWPREFSEFDISLPDIASTTKGQGNEYSFTANFKKGDSCTVWITPDNMVRCTSANNKMMFYYKHTTLQPLLCLAYTNYKGGIQMCQQETGKTTADHCEENTYCLYYY